MAKKYTYSLTFILSLFVILFVTLNYYTRLASDDYFFIWDIQHHGMLKSAYLQYIQWSGRFLSTLSSGIFYKLFLFNNTYYFILSLSIFILLIVGFYKLISNLFLWQNSTINKFQKILLAVSSVAMLFFLSINTGETWFWFCSLSSYLWSIVAFVWGLSFLFSNKKNVLTYLGIISCFVYCGQTSEVYSVVYGILFLVLFIFQLKKNNHYNDFIKNSFNRKLITITCSLGISFFIVLIAPGNYSRATQFPTPTLINTIELIARMSFKLFFYFIPQKLIYVFIFSIPFLLVGKLLNNGEQINFKPFFKKIQFATLLLFISIIIVFASIAILTSQSGEYRVWFIISFLLTIYFITLSFYAGYLGLISTKKIELLKKISLILGIIILMYDLITQFETTKKYASSYDERIIYLKKKNEEIKNDTLLILPPLHSSGMLFSSEISNDTSHFTNKELRLCFNLKYHIAVKNAQKEQ